jgi:hypothetical protein
VRATIEVYVVVGSVKLILPVEEEVLLSLKAILNVVLDDFEYY